MSRAIDEHAPIQSHLVISSGVSLTMERHTAPRLSRNKLIETITTTRTTEKLKVSDKI